MKTLKAFMFVGLLALGLQTVWAADAADSSIGTWKLNLQKSAFGSRHPPRSEVRTYSLTSKGTRVVITEIDQDGKKSVSRTLLTYDGKTHPVRGSANYDAASTERISANETTADMLLKGKVVGSLRRVVSDDGKTLTMNMKLDKADGTQEMTMSVFDRQ